MHCAQPEKHQPEAVTLASRPLPVVRNVSSPSKELFPSLDGPSGMRSPSQGRPAEPLPVVHCLLHAQVALRGSKNPS